MTKKAGNELFMHSQSHNEGTNLRPRVVYVVTSDLAVGFMRGQLHFLQEQHFDVILISSPGNWLDEAGRIENVRIIGLPMAREIAPLKDLVSLWRLWRTIRALRPAITNVGTPKAGLLGGCAAWLTGVPCRFYTLHGLRCETSKGLRRNFLISAEHLACHFANRVICVSRSLREKAIAFGLTTQERSVVLGSGSCNGVNASQFAPTPERTMRASELRLELGIPPDAPVIGFVGRLTRDKGISELVEAFRGISNEFPDLRLLLLGLLEEEDRLDSETRKYLETHPRIILAGYIEDTSSYYALMDILALPSHREGFGNVVLEAYAAGKPVVAARATGLVDAVMDGETGLLFPVGDVGALAHCLRRLLSDKIAAAKLGSAGQELVKREFRQKIVWNALMEEYRRLLHTKSLSRCVVPVGKEAAHFGGVPHE